MACSLSVPIVAYADALDQAPSPLGFVLSKDVLVTIRYTPLRSFDAVVAKLSKNVTPLRHSGVRDDHR